MMVPAPLYWHQGLLLRPQHFQLQDHAHQALLAPLLDHALPHFWGVGILEINEQAPATGVFLVERGSFLFPDGSYVVVHENAHLQARTLPQGWQASGEALTVYIGLKSWSALAPNATLCDPEENLHHVSTRYVTWRRPSCDEEPGGVRTMQYLLKLFWESDLPQSGDYQVIPIARLESVEGRVVLVDSFIPPTLTLDGSRQLSALLVELRLRLTSKADELAGYKLHGSRQQCELRSREVMHLLALHCLNRYLPLFYAAQSGRTHPWDLYGTLWQLAAELSNFSRPPFPPGESDSTFPLLPPYDHSNLGSCFSRLRDLIIRLLNELRPGPDFVVTLDHDGTYFSTELPPTLLDGNSSFYLALRCGIEAVLLRKAFETAAKVATREQLPHLTTRSLPGIRLTPLDILPQELPRHHQTLYLALDASVDQWRMLATAGNLALFWADAPPDLEVQLMAVNRHQEQPRGSH